MKKAKRSPCLMLLLIFGFLFWLPVYSYGQGFSPVIGFTTQQMAVNGTQNLSVNGGSGGPYTWEILHGGGSLSGSEGNSITYTAPASNPNCVNNPTIQVTDSSGQTASLNMAVNAYPHHIETAYVWTDSPSNAQCGSYTECCWRISAFRFFCDGSFHAWLWDCTSCDAPPPGNCSGCYTKLIYDPPNACWGNWKPDTTSMECLPDQLLERCTANNACGQLTGIPISCSGPTDVRTAQLKSIGCCPFALISPCQMSITGFKSSENTINLSSGQGTTITGTITGNPVGSTNWTLTVEGTGWAYSGSGSAVSLYWNGRTPLGKEVPPGVYNVTLSAQTVGGICDGNIIQQTILLNVTANPSRCLWVEGGSAVNAASGNLNHSQTLFRLPNARFKGDFSLFYNSFDGQMAPLGQGWTHSYNIRLLSNNDGSYTLIEGDGQKTVLFSNGSRYTPQKSNFPALIKYTDNTYALGNKDGLTYYFNAGKIITGICDRNSNTLYFTYDGSNNLIGIIDPSGRTTSLQYDQSKRISLITDPLGNSHYFTYTGPDLTAVSSQINGLGVQNWVYGYDGKGNMLTRTDPEGFVTTYVYDSDFRMIQATDPQGRYRTMTYNPSQNATQLIEKDGGLWTYTYDVVIGAMTAKTDPLGYTTHYYYDSNWNLAVVTDPRGNGTWYTYDANGNTVSMTDSLGYTTSYTYNALNKIAGIVYPDNASVVLAYDTLGNLTSLTDPMGNWTQYGYDSRGNPTTITNALNQTTSLTYNQNNYLVSLTDPTGAVTSFANDGSGNLISQIDPLNNTTTFAYNGLNKPVRITDPLGQITDLGYDLNGNLSSKIDGNSNLTQYQYNYMGQVTRIADALNQVTRFTYGSGCPGCGSGVEKLTALTDARGQTTAFEYNPAGKLIKETDPLGYFKTYSYDGAGSRVSMTDENNHTTQYMYDPLNRLVQVTYPDGTTKILGYDARGNMTSAANPNIGYTFSYDLSNRLTGVLDSNGKSLSYQYDPLNNRTQMAAPDGRIINYGYDSGNRLSQIISERGIFGFSYDLAGKRTGMIYPNGVTTTYNYNPASYLTDLLVRKSQSTVNSFSYTHDAVGNRLSMADLTGLHTYQYDPIYQLIQAVHSNIPTEQFSYDPVGNRLDAAFDEVGGLKANTQYTYDYENRLTRVQYPGMDARYKYDPLGRRIEKNVNGQITRYVYDGDNMIAEYDGTGVVKSKYLFNLAIDDPLSVEQSGSVYYYHKDGLGSVTELTNSGGNIAKAYRYNSFGEIYSQSGSLTQPFTFTGREYDSESGLYYYRARYYDPSAGIFIGKDPIGFEGGDGNLFRYVGNNPINDVDAMGLAIWICSRKTKFGIGNHAYLWNDKNNSCCGMGSTETCKEKGPKRGDYCRRVEGSDGLENRIMLCCKDTADLGRWIPPLNDCHTAADDCLISAGLKNPGVPGGRLSKPCDPCSK
ncbi:MAG: RHS repeat protein [Deltaproteobacteria bacterium]|nr:RHS repeat protein [Deltaproteobacteria bacterium]